MIFPSFYTGRYNIIVALVSIFLFVCPSVSGQGHTGSAGQGHYQCRQPCGYISGFRYTASAYKDSNICTGEFPGHSSCEL